MSRGIRAAVAALVIVAGAAPATAVAGPTSSSTAIVSLGDSYISGEAGRWQGNSTDYVDRDGTDRACVSRTWWGGCNFDYDRVYSEIAARDLKRQRMALHAHYMF